ncbi:MAG: hypothetical protein J6Y57_01120 [Lachnospiraceae bacterium]|nr:hypothetical protein [Lachnospiraceae bacterium]
MSMTYDVSGFGGGRMIGDLSLFGNLTFEQMAKRALEEVRPDMEEGTKAALRSSIQHPGDSELVNSVKCFEPRMTGNGEGAVIVCQPVGKSKSGNRYHTVNRGKTISKAVMNNDKAFWLEYGNAHQTAHPWKDRAANSIEAKSTSKIQQAIEKELGAE